MRRVSSKAKDSSKALVGVIVDGASSYGRAILRGVLRHANVQQRWVMHLDLWQATAQTQDFPKADGAILAGVGASEFEVALRRCRHVVSCSGSSDPTRMPVVSLDDEAVGAMAAEHLLDCRLEHFAFYGLYRVSHPTTASIRLSGFRRVVEQRGYGCIESPVAWPTGTDWLTHAHRPALVKWLRSLPKPIGIMAGDDAVAYDLAATCREAGIRVPDSVAIIGVNNDDLLCESAWPPLSSVEADFSRVGYEAARLLGRMMDGERVSGERRRLRLPPLGVRQRLSTSILAVDDADLAEAIRFIREHACDPCTVYDVLKHVPVGRRRLERQFAAVLGRTPHEEIIRVRIDRAKKMLLQPEVPMVDVALRCGFSAVTNFNRVFRRTTGTTPGAYRREARRLSVR